MPSNIDDRIVNMQFNNKRFESGVADTMKTLDQFQTKLNNLDGGKGFEELEKAANKIDLSSVGKSLTVIEEGVTTVSDKFSAWGVAAKRVIENISDDAYRLGKQFVSSLSIDQVKAGWDKYGSMAQSVGTIMSATGLDIEAVTEQMERLNWYTDETSYNYTDMADNIAKFTSQEIPLEKATEAMMGIANWSALAGQNAATASRAMYNVSQAMGIGYMGLADWKSIELANMGTAQFKQHVLDVAVEMGKLKKVTDDTGESFIALDEEAKLEDAITVANFRESLKQKWFDSEVMERVFQDYGKFATKLNETINELNEADETLGINATDILGILEEYDENKSLDKLNQRLRGTKTSAQDVTKYLDILSSKTYELSRKAFAAAQEYKTFSDAIDATKDAVSTQWLNTFSYIFGNYEEAKELWTAFGGTLYDLFATAGEERNAVLREWKAFGADGGRDTLVSAILEALETLDNVVFAIKDGFEKIFPSIDAKKLKEITESFKKFIDGIYISEDDTEKLEKISSIVSHLAGAAKTVFSSLGAILSTISSAIKETFLDGINLDTLDKTAEGIENFVKNFAISKDDLKVFKEAISGVLKVIKRISPIFVKAGGAIVTILFKMGEAIGGFIAEAVKFTGDAVNGILDFFDRFKKNEKLADSLTRLHDAFKKLFDAIKTNASKVNEKLNGFFEALGLSDGANTLLGSLADTIANLIIIVADFISNGVEKLAAFFENTDIIEKAVELWNKFSDSIKNVYDKVSDFLAPAIDTVSGSLKSAYESAKEYLPAAFDWLGEKLEGAYNAVKEFLQPAADKVSEFFGSFKDSASNIDFSSIGVNIGGAGGTIWGKLSEFFGKVKNEWIPLLWDLFKKKFPKVAEALQTAREWIEDFWKSENKFEAIKTVIGGISGAIGGFFKTAFEQLKAVWNWLKETIGNLGPSGVVLAAFAGGLIAILVSLLNILDKMTGPVAGVLGSVEGFLNSGKKLLNAAKVNQIAAALNTLANAVKTLSTAFLILTVSMKVIDSLKNAGKAVGVLGAMAGGIVLLLGAFRLIGTTKDKDKNVQAINFFGDAAKLLIGVAISMLAFVSVAKKVGEMSEDEWWKGFLRTLAILGVMVLAVVAATPKDGTRSAIKGALGILALALAVDLLTKSLNNMRAVDLLDAIAKTKLLKGVAKALGSLSDAFTKHKIKAGKYEHEDKVSILGAAAVIAAFVIAMREMTRIKMDDIDILGVLFSIGVMIGSVAAVLAIVNKFTKNAKNAKDSEKQIAYIGAGLLALAAAAAVMGMAMSKIKVVDPVSFVIMAGVYVALIGAMALLIKASHTSKSETSGGAGAALEIAALAGALTLLAVTIGLLSLLDWKKLIAPTAVILGLIGMLAVLVKASAGLSKDSFKSIIAAGIIISLVTAIVGVISAIGAEKFAPAVAIVGATVLFIGLLLYMISNVSKNTIQVGEIITGLFALIASAGAILAASFILVTAIAAVKNAQISNSDLKTFAIIAGVLVLVAGVVTHIGKSLKGVSFGQVLSNIAKTIIPVVAALVMLHLAALMMSSLATSMSGTTISKDVAISVVAMAGVLILIAGAITHIAKSLSGVSLDKLLPGLGKTIMMLGAALAILVVAQLMISLIAADGAGKYTIPKNTLTSITAMSLLLVLLAGVVAVAAKKLSSSSITIGTIGEVGLVLAMSAGLILLVTWMTKLISSMVDGAKLPDKEALIAIGAMALVLGLVSTLIGLTAKLLQNAHLDYKQVFAALEVIGGAVIVLAGVVGVAKLLSLLLKNYTPPKTMLKQLGSIMLVAGAITVIAGVVALLAKEISILKVTKSDMGNMVTMLGIAAALLIFAGGVVWLINNALVGNNIDIGTFSSKILAIGEVMLVIGLATAMLGGLAKIPVSISDVQNMAGGLLAGAALFIVASALVVIINNAILATNIDAGQFTLKILAIGEVLVAIGLATAMIGVLSKIAVDSSKLLDTLLMLGTGVIFFGVAAALAWVLNKVFEENPIDIGKFTSNMLGIGEIMLGIGAATAMVLAIGTLAGKDIATAATAATAGLVAVAIILVGAALLAALFAGIGAAVGGTDKLNEFLRGGFDVMVVLVEGLADVAKAFVKGAIDATLGALIASLGTSLGDFWTNGEPFFDGIAEKGDKIGLGMISLAGGLIAFVAAEVIDGLARILGLTNNTASIGTVLGDIWENGKPFFEGVAEYGDKLGSAMVSFAGGLLAFVGVEVVDGLARMFGLTGNVDRIAEIFDAMGAGMVAFYDHIKGDINLQRLNRGIEGISSLCSVMSQIPLTGGIFEWITGERDFKAFGEGMEKLGSGLYTFYTKTKDIEPEKLSVGTSAVSILTKLNDIVPKTGGILQTIFGESGLGKFGESLPVLGEGLAKFVDNIGDRTYENVEKAADALELLAPINDLIPRSDGVLQMLLGGKDLAGFAKALPDLGTGIYEFASSVASAFDALGDRGSSIVDEAIGWIEKFANFFNSLDNTGGLWGLIAGDQTLEPLAEGMGLLGTGFYDFATAIEEIQDDAFDKAVTYGNRIVAMLAKIGLTDLGTYVTQFNDALLTFSGRITNYVNTMKTYTSDDFDIALDFVQKFIDLADNADFSGIVKFSSAFSTVADLSIELFLTKFEESWPDAKDAGSKFMQKCYEGMRFILTDANLGVSLIATDTADAFIDALDDKTGKTISDENTAMRAGWALSKAVRDGMGKGASKSDGKQLGNDIGQGLIDGLNEKVKPINDKAFEIGSSVIRQLRFATRTMSPSREAMEVGRFIDIGLAKGMDMYTSVAENSAENLGDNTIEAMKNSITRINEAIDADMNLDPTIRPVVDLSGLQSGSSAAARLLNGGSMSIAADRLAVTSDMAAELAASEGTQNGTVNGGLISEILGRIDALSDDIRHMQLVMDSGAVVGSIAGQMDSALGQMAVYRGRGN